MQSNSPVKADFTNTNISMDKYRHKCYFPIRFGDCILYLFHTKLTLICLMFSSLEQVPFFHPQIWDCNQSILTLPSNNENEISVQCNLVHRRAIKLKHMCYLASSGNQDFRSIIQILLSNHKTSWLWLWTCSLDNHFRFSLKIMLSGFFSMMLFK